MGNTVAQRLSAIREQFQKAGVQALVVPSADPHMSEYVAAHFLRRGFASGFDGSAGTLVLTADAGALWTDFRYYLQGELQLAGSGLELCKVGLPETPAMEDWLAQKLPGGGKVGVNASVFSVKEYADLKEQLKRRHFDLVALDADPVDAVWAERPPFPCEPARLHPLEVAGESVESKHLRLQREMREAKADALLVAALDEVAWLTNLRGGDVDFNPVFLGYALVDRQSVILYTAQARLRDVLRALPQVLKLRPYEALASDLAERAKRGEAIWMDPTTANEAVAGGFQKAGGMVLSKGSPIPKWKAAKNEPELDGMRRAHLRDGVAMVEFLARLDELVATGATERSVAEGLHQARMKAGGAAYIGPSFGTIVAYGDHGAIVHYTPTEESDRPLAAEGILLLDSGGQYVDGTTDITRTVTLGRPTAEQIRAYTAVLKGHLRFGSARWKPGLDGYKLDMVARGELWRLGYDYGHGTGHGVGAALCVHEGPFRAHHFFKNLTPLEEGNVMSNEPGYYQSGGFGVRIENLVIVRKVSAPGEEVFLGFEPLTFCPYDLRLVDQNLLEKSEIAQIRQYHAKVLEKLLPLLSPEAAAWLVEVTRG